MPTSRKKILIINSHFGIGGIETAMVNMANELCNYYDVDLFVYYPEGPMKERLDSRVNVLKPCFAFKAIGMSLKQALQSGNLLVILFKLLGSLWSRICDNRLPIYIATKIQKKFSRYDLAIAFRQEASKSELASGFIRVMNKCVNSKKNVAWIHCDSTEFADRQKFNRKYYKQVDKIIGVSKSVADAFAKMNPELKEKTDYCYNFIDYDNLYKKSKEEQKIKYPQDKFICFSASRLGAEKGIVRGIKAIAPVFKEHTDVLWYIAGDGPERANIEAIIEQEGLQGRIILLGNQSNPYPYMKNSDLYMSLSFHEAAPMVYMEAKTLGVPVFTTRTLSSYEMLEEDVNAFICENSEKVIRDKFAQLMNNRNLIEDTKHSLKDLVISNAYSIGRIREMLL